MLNPVRSSQFKKDLKKARRQGKDLNELQAVILALAEGRPLEERLRNHELRDGSRIIWDNSLDLESVTGVRHSLE